MDMQKGFLISITLGLLFIAGKLLQPFLGYLLGTVMIAFVLYPLQKRLSPKIGERVSAALLIALTVVIIIIPFALSVNAVIGDAQDLSTDFNETQLLQTDNIEQKVYELTGQQVDINGRFQDLFNSFISNAVGNVSQVLNILTNLSIGITVSSFALFYFLKDGKKFKNWIQETTPLPQDIQDQLYSKTYKTSWAVVKGHVIVAIAQGTIAGLGLYLAGIESYAFWTFIMILLAFIPLVGAFLIWGPAGAYLIATGRPAPGIFLLIWGSVAVGLTDNFLRPLLVDREAELHPAVILIGVLGGLTVFGAAGIFMGPIALGVLKSVLEVFRNNYDEL